MKTKWFWRLGAALLLAVAIWVVYVAFTLITALTGAFAAEASIKAETIVCIPKRPVEIKAATPELKIEWRRLRLDKAIKAKAKLPWIRSATEFEKIKPTGLTKQEEAALKRCRRLSFERKRRCRNE
ncbi:MAG: hypothetical protein AB1656_05160 [Candidatus Omnitrophota bacterium]